MQENTDKPYKKVRYSISVPTRTYERLRAAVAPGNLAALVDEIITGMLDDPSIAMAVVARCQQGRGVGGSAEGDFSARRLVLPS